MPENPEAEARAKQVEKLRSLAGQIMSEAIPKLDVRSGRAIDLRQAANEIEDLGRLKREVEFATENRIVRSVKEYLVKLVMYETGYKPRVLLTKDTDEDDLSGVYVFGCRAETRPLTITLDLQVERRGPDV